MGDKPGLFAQEPMCFKTVITSGVQKVVLKSTGVLPLPFLDSLRRLSAMGHFRLGDVPFDGIKGVGSVR